MAGVFDGLKVVDFSWVATGPLCTKYLADHGATVVRVESATRPDIIRWTPPFRDGEPGLNRSARFANFNSSKLGMALNLGHPRGREVAWRLIQWADVVTESFTPGVMRRLGLDYERVCPSRPDIVYLSTSQLGQTGPWASHPGFGTQLAALSGFYYLSGWEDRDPAGPYGAYTDFINFRLAALSIISALDARRRTGRGQYIDLAQLEGGIQFLAPLVMDAFLGGEPPGRMGNRSATSAPHNAYPCRGEDRWCVIAVESDDQWCRLVEAMGSPAWATDPAWATLEGRKRSEDALDRHIASWTAQFDAVELMEHLQAADVPAGVVQTCEDMYRDPQLIHRGHFVVLEHAEIGPHAYDGVAFRLSRTPGGPRFAAPCLGQHTEHVCRELLGMSAEEFAALRDDGVFV